MITIGLARSNKRAGPGGVLTAEAYVDAASQMALGKFCRVPHVEQLRTRVSQAEHFVEWHGVQNPLQVGVEGYPLAGVQYGVVGEVLRSVGLVGRYQADEFFLRHRLQGVVQAALISQRGDGVGG